jgi:ATP-dependent Clp protease adaptor protein ClpS
MSAKAAEAVETQEPKVNPQRRNKPDTRKKPRQQPPYAVVLHDDPVNGFDFVMGVLKKVFRYNVGKAFALTLRAHPTGRCHVWVGSLEVAELKAEQIQSCGPDPRKKAEGATALGVSLEPLSQ